MSGEQKRVDPVEDSLRPVLQLTAVPDLRGNWNIELQLAWLESKGKLVKTGIGTGTSAAGIVAGLIELLEQAHAEGYSVPRGSCTLWAVAANEASQ